MFSMSQKLFYSILMLALLSFHFNKTIAQNKKKYTISGYIEDATSGEKLLATTILDTNSRKGTISNTYGFYSITLPEGNVSLLVSYIGYERQIQNINLNKDLKFNINLQPAATLKEVTITDKVENKIENRTEMSVTQVPIQQMKKIPALLGEVDILKVLQLTPGVQSGGEGTSGLYVRGGGPDQNLILLDGVPVYNASHLFGFFSVFNSDAISNVTLTKGGYPARYGGRLSSVIDITMKEGNNKKFHGEGGVGIIASRLTVEGPIWKDRTSFIVSGRRTYIDVLAQPFILAQSDGQAAGGYFFYDLNGKINHKINDKNRLYLSAYGGRDKFYVRQSQIDDFEKSTFQAGIGWGNITSALRWNSEISSKLFSNLTLTFTDYNFNVSAEQSTKQLFAVPPTTDEFKLNFTSGIKDFALKWDFDYMPSPNHLVKYGVSAIRHKFSPEAIQLKIKDNQTDSNIKINPSPNIFATEAFIYIEDEWKINNRLIANVGLHTSAFWVKNSFYWLPQPRIAVRYLLPYNIALKGSFATMQQYIHLLSNSGVSLPTDLWLPATDKIKPQRSQQIALGLAKTLLNDQFEVSVEAYYKTMDGLIEYKNGASFLGSSNWENKVESNGKGWARGVELFIQKKSGKTTGWIGYTLAKTDRQFEGTDINYGKKFPYRYDRRHDISIVVSHEFNKKWQLSSTWVYGTGNAVSFPLELYNGMNTPGGQYNFFGGQLQSFGERNSFRMNAYHRFDVGVSYTKQKKRHQGIWNLSVYNAYNRRNPFFIQVSSQYAQNPATGQVEETRVASQFSLFPIVPSISYSFKF